MIKINLKMKSILSTSVINANINLIRQMCKNIICNTKVLESHDCIVYDPNNEIDDSKLEWDFILKTNNDLTGFEMNCNEILINNYVEYNAHNAGNIIVCFLKCFSDTIKQTYPSKSFCIVMYEDNGILFLRFHTYRYDEGLWVSENIDNYSSPLLYKII